MAEFFCVAAAVLLGIMVIGHGMWVVAAWLLGALGRAGSEDLGKPCTQCGARSGVKYGRCVACGAVPSTPTHRSIREDDLQTTSRQLKQLCQKGAISQQQRDELVAIINAELTQLAPRLGESVPPRLAPAPPAMANTAHARNLPAVEPEVIDAILIEPLKPAERPAAEAGPGAKLHPLDRPYIPPPPKTPSQPGRSLADMLQSFMEESNIRWGEILAATLIVLCSVGLVISLRNTLKNIPYFPAILFTLFTVSFHSAGLYTLRRWKLQAVSRVILIISLLLVPLTICGAIVLQQTRPVNDPLFLVALISGIGIFAWVCYTASRELVGVAAWPLTIGVLGSSLAQVLIQRLDFAGDQVWRLSAAAAIPLGSFLVATAWQIARARRWRQFSKMRVVQILRVLGIATFALLPPLALILVHSERSATTVAHLSPQLSLAAAAALALGLLIHRRTTAKRLATWQTVGTAILVLAGLLLLLFVVAAWPDPELLLVLGLMNCTALAVLGVVAELPLLYVPSVACAALAMTIGWHLVGGHFADRSQLSLKIVQAALRGQTSVALGVLGAIVAALGSWLFQRKRAGDALMLLGSTGGLAVISILIALFSGFVSVPEWPQDRDLAAAILLVYAIALIAAGPLARRPEVAGCGSALLWLTFVQALVFNSTIRGWLAGMQWLPERPVLAATLAHGVMTAIGALASEWLPLSASGWLGLREAIPQSARSELHSTATAQSCLSPPLAVGAAISLAAATPFIVWVPEGHFSASAVMALWAALGWAALALSQRWPWAVSALQAMLALAPALIVAGIWKARVGGPNWFLDAQHLFAQLIAAALATLVWSPARRLTTERDATKRLLNAPWPAVDQVLLGVAAVGLPLVTILIVMPGIGWELSFDPYIRSSSLATAGNLPDALRYGWIALAVVLAALAVSLWERISVPATVGLGIATFAAVSLAAGHFESTVAAASASRWTAAIYALLWGAAYIARDPLRATFKRLPHLRWNRFSRGALIWFCAQPLLLGGRAILILTIIAVYQNANGVALRGPVAESVFAAMDPTVSYAAPLLALVVVLLGYAIRERQAGFALGGAAVSQLAVNLAYLLHVDSAQPADLRAIEWLQWNSVAAGAYALVWLGLSRWITPASASEGDRRSADGLWLIPLTLSGVIVTALAGWAGLAIANSPAVPLPVLLPLGSWLSYLAVGLILAAVLWRAGGRLEIQGLGDAATWLAAGLVPLVAATLNRLDRGGQWLAYHTLEGGWLAVSGIACGLVCWKARSSRQSRLTPHHLSVAFIAGLVVVLAVRGNRLDPAQPWWSLTAVLVSCAISTALGLARRSQPYAFVSTGLAGLAVILLWIAPAAAPWIKLIFVEPPIEFFGGLEIFSLVLALAAGFWLSREITYQQRLAQSFDVRATMPRVHAVVLLAVVTGYFLYRLAIAGFLRQAAWTYDIVSVGATLAIGGALLAALWDRRAIWTLPALYLWGGVVWCLLIGLARPWPAGAEPRVTIFLLALALHVALTGQIWSYGANLAALGERLGVSDPVAGLTRTARWLPIVNLLLAATVCVVDLMLVLSLDELPFRVAAAWGPAIVAWGVLCLAQERRRDALQLTSLLVAGLSAIYLAWAQIDPLESSVWMTRVFRLLMVLATLTFGYGLVLPRLLLTSGSWNAATRKAGYVAAVVALATFVVTLVLETALFQPGIGNGVDAVQVVAIAVVLIALIAGLISLAVLPGRDPLVLSERGRQGYVYAAEITGALLFAHLYVCKPMWFDGLLRPYWPFIVMGLAFLGTGAAELFERFHIRVLAEPLARTGAMLPLLPVLGWWAAKSNVDYSLLLLIAGILYLALSYTRKSWAAMVAAAVAGNGALWALLSDTHLSFATNPQLWLIPPALSVLVAAQVNRHRLTPEMLAGIRYAATIVIYVSSTSEIVTRGFAAGLVPPMVLLGLAVAGALAGIAFRVRGFLILGSTFTLIALVAMVRHAAQAIDNTWPWWVFGIALGVSVLVLLGMFEKKRTEVTLLIDRLRQWDH